MKRSSNVEKAGQEASERKQLEYGEKIKATFSVLVKKGAGTRGEKDYIGKKIWAVNVTTI